jgi:predicted outer membrane repeat protein
MVDEGCSATITSCTFTGNSALTYGGGILWVTPSAVPILKDSTFRGNFGGAGGALFCKFGASPQITSCNISGNLANGPGGAMCCLVDSSPVLMSCSLLGNSASVGGALSLETVTDSPTLINCALAGNFAFAGGALIANEGSSPKLMNCTIYGNGAEDDNGAIECVGEDTLPSVVNTIVWGNLPDSLCGNATFILNDDPTFVQAGVFDLTRTKTVELGGIEHQMPDFLVEPGDYRLKAGSPAIDAGKADGAPSTDLQGQTRPCGGGVDIGAYEFCDPGPGAPFRRGDANQDQKSDISDAGFILNFLFLGGPAPACPKSADANDSGKIDLSDAVYILRFLFLGGAPIPEPAASCGGDPTSDELSCESFAPCVV